MYEKEYDSCFYNWKRTKGRAKEWVEDVEMHVQELT